MAKKAGRTSYSGPTCEKMSCCKIEALISVDERGQMVLPKEVKDKADIHTGDKSALINWGRERKICCLAGTCPASPAL